MEEEIIKRTLPHNLEAEQSVIGAMLMDEEAIFAVMEILKSEDFYGRQYALLFEAITDLYNDGKPADLVTVQERLMEKGAPPEISSIDFLRDLFNNLPTSANAKYYAGIVRDKAILRRMIRNNDEINKLCYEGKESTESILDQAEREVFHLARSGTARDYVPVQQIVLDVIEQIEAAARNGGCVTGIPTGFVDLDYKTSGFQPSDLILIAARPSMGKTAFLLNIVEYMSIRKHIPAAVFSLEMSKEQMVNRLFAQESKVDSQAIRTGNLQDSDWERLAESADLIGNSEIIFDDTPGITVQELRSRCRKYKLEKDVGIVFIDYLQLMSGSGRKNDNRQQEISDISRALKSLARELSIPVVALSQLSRAVEGRPDHRPMLSDLRESGAIEQDADVVMFLYRDDYYNPDTEEKNVAEVIIAKQRNGPIGTVKLAWLPQYTKFANAGRPPKLEA